MRGTFLIFSFLLALIAFDKAQASCEEDRANGIINFTNTCLASDYCSGVYCFHHRTELVGTTLYCPFTTTGPSGPYPESWAGLTPIAIYSCPSTPKAPDVLVPANPPGSCRAPAPVKKNGSIVGVETQTLGESVDIVGVPFPMYYHSGYQSGYSKDFKVKFSVTPSTPSTYSQTYNIELKRGGVVIDTASFSSLVANQWYEYLWNGLDATNTYSQPSESFDVSIAESVSTFSMTRKFTSKLSHFDAKQFGLGGWLPSVFRYYDVNGKRMFYATGSAVDVEAKAFGSNLYVADASGSEVYIFDSTGRHLYTKTAMLGTTVLSFNYDSSGRLSSIAQPFSKTTTFDRSLLGDFVSITAPNGQVTSVSLDVNGYISGFTNPNSEAYTMTYYSTQGLMHTFQKPNSEVSTFTFNSDGLLTQDSHSGGYFFQLARDLGSASNYDIYVTSSMSRVSRINSNIQSNGDVSRTKSNSNGQTTADSYTYYSYNNTSWIRSTTGGVTDDWYITNDPRFGNMVRVPYYSSQMRNGMRSYSYTRSITLSDVNDPFSITAWSFGAELSGTSTSSSTVFNPSNKKFTSTTGVGVVSEAVIDSYERPVSFKKGSLDAINFNYTNEKLTSVVQGSRTTSLSYNSNDLLQSVTNPLSQTTSFVYDSANRIYSKIFPDSRAVTFAYDGAGNLTGITPPGKPIHNFSINSHGLVGGYTPPSLTGLSAVSTTYSYNLDKQLTGIVSPSGNYINFNYNSGGMLTGLSTSSGSISYNMDASKQLPYYISTPTSAMSIYRNGFEMSGSSYFVGPINGYYNSNTDRDLIVSDNVNAWVSTGSSSSVSYSYNNDERLATAGDISISYNTPNGQITGTTMGSGGTGFSDSYTYNSYGEITGYQAQYGSATIYDLVLTRDGMGRISGKTQTMNSITNDFGYTFDSSGRLTQVSKNSSVVSNYGYDTNSNRNSGNIGAQTTSATYDDQDRLSTYNTLSFTYNADGVLATKTNATTSQTVQYTYDVFGNLTQVNLPGSTVVNYNVDALNRRVGKKVNGVLQVNWIYSDQYRIVAEFDSTGGVMKRFVYGSKSNIPDYMIYGGEKYRIISDQLGSPRLVVKQSDGSIAQMMDHDEYGRVITDTNPGFIPFGFAGGLYDSQTGLVRFGARDYDPEIGRWTSKDPILFNGGDTNLYGYVENDAVNWIDPNGTSKGKPGQVLENDPFGGGGGPPASSANVSIAIKPNGQLIGQAGTSSRIRIMPGGLQDAQNMYGGLCRGGTPSTPSNYPGQMVRFSDGGTVGFRPSSSSGPPTIDINIPGITGIKIKFTGD